MYHYEYLLSILACFLNSRNNCQTFDFVCSIGEIQLIYLIGRINYTRKIQKSEISCVSLYFDNDAIVLL